LTATCAAPKSTLSEYVPARMSTSSPATALAAASWIVLQLVLVGVHPAA
jgi:hypothetical protein